MGKQLPNISRFRERIAREREQRGWSQAEVARMLTAMGIDSMYNTTVAKIEAGDREIKLDEAVAMADLFELDLNDLRARERDLDYLIEALSDIVVLSRTELDRTARSLWDRMDDIPADYKDYNALAEPVADAVCYLGAARKCLDKLVEHFPEHIEQRAGQTVWKVEVASNLRVGTRHET